MARSPVVTATAALQAWLHCRVPELQRQAWHGLASLAEQLEWRAGRWPITEIDDLLARLRAGVASGVLEVSWGEGVRRATEAADARTWAYEVHHLRDRVRRSGILGPSDDVDVANEDDHEALADLARAVAEMAEDPVVLADASPTTVHLFHAAYHALEVCGMGWTAYGLARQRCDAIAAGLDPLWPGLLGVLPADTCGPDPQVLFGDSPHPRAAWAQLPLLHSSALWRAWHHRRDGASDGVAVGIRPAWAYVVAMLDGLQLRFHEEHPDGWFSSCTRCVRVELLNMVHGRPPVDVRSDEAIAQRQLAVHTVVQTRQQFSPEYYVPRTTQLLRAHYSALPETEQACIDHLHQLTAVVRQAEIARAGLPGRGSSP